MRAVGLFATKVSGYILFVAQPRGLEIANSVHKAHGFLTCVCKSENSLHLQWYNPTPSTYNSCDVVALYCSSKNC